MQINSPSRDFIVQPCLRKIFKTAQLRNAHSEQIDGPGARETWKEIGTRRAPAANRLVDDDRGALKLAAVPITRIDDGVLDDVRARRAAIPKQIVEVRDV